MPKGIDYMAGKDWDQILAELHDQGFTHRKLAHIKSLYFKVNNWIRDEARTRPS